MGVTYGKFSDESVNERIEIAFTKIKMEKGMKMRYRWLKMNSIHFPLGN